MRDPKRIDRILMLIRTIWMAYPDFRLCQLIGNVFPAGDHYYESDEKLQQGLLQNYSHIFNPEED